MATKSGKRRRWSRIVTPLIFTVVILLLWEFAISNDDNVQQINQAIENLTGWNPDMEAMAPTILPRPSRIAKQLLVTPRNQKGGPAYFWRHTKATLFAAGLGFVIGNAIAIITATTFLYFKPLERGLMPIALALRSMPLVAITPLLLRIRFTISDLDVVQNTPWLKSIFGTDLVMKLLIVIIICYFPTLVNVARGLTSAEPSSLELMHSLRASRWQTYWKLRVPTALPLTFAALRVASSSAVLGAVVAEWLSSSQGLGFVIFRSHADMSEAKMWMAMIISCAMAIIAFALVGVVQRLAIPWHRPVVHLRGALETEA
jgi:NitT/TauT family transport system permease protein